MEIKVSKNNEDTYYLTLSGDMDLNSSIQLKDTVMKVIRNNVEYCFISLKNVTSISSAGLGALVWCFSTLKKLNCPLVIIAQEGIVMQALEATRIKGYFTVVSSLKEALSFAAAKRQDREQTVAG